MIKKWRKDLLLKRLNNDTDREAKIIAKQHKMRKFVIINKSIQEVFPDILNGALNTDSKRIYIYTIPFTTVDFLMNELLRISENTEAVSVEFDQYQDGYNLEIEIYLGKNSSEDFTYSVFDIQYTPCTVKLSGRFYFELIGLFDRKVI